MKLCIPIDDEAGPESRVSGHFGRAPFYAFVETETDAIEIVPNPGHDHAHPPDFVLTQGPDALAARGMGQGAYDRFRGAGVRLLTTTEPTLAATVEALRAGSLRDMGPDDVHAGGHGHGEHHHRHPEERHR